MTESSPVDQSFALDEDGFLGHRIEEWTKDHRLSSRELFSLCEELNRECHRFLSGRSVRLDSEIEKTSAVLFARMMEHYQSVIVLLERGMDNSARVMFRAFLEGYFALKAMMADPDFLDLFLNQFLLYRKSTINRIRNSTHDLLQSIRDEFSDELVEEINQQIQDLGVRKLTIEEMARRAGLEPVYAVAYIQLCQATHTSAFDLENHLRIESESDEIVGFRYGPSNAEASRLLPLACMCMADSLEEVSKIFGVDPSPLCGEVKTHFRPETVETNEDKSDDGEVNVVDDVTD